MEGLIPDEIVDRVRSGNDIVELVSEYVSLKRTGANYIGLCPFHTEKTPSFTVSPSKQIFHCFGCGAGGDVVGFLIRHDNYTFPEAVRRLAERAGIRIPETGTDRARTKGDFEPLIKANVEAADFFARRLWESKEGGKARSYLEGRGFSEDVAREFGLGYSPSGWDGLLSHLEKKGIGPETAHKAGLALPRTSGSGYYDRFRDRLMFPIRDARGRVVGFGGRTMADEEPKYLNSPETPLFRKGETLYGLDTASEHVRKQDYAVVVEGYFDAIACQKAGVKNAVATLGTALTPAHLRLLGRFSKKVVVVFDSDPAGIKAAERSLDVFLETNMTAKVALLPQGDDPDSLVKREGPAGLKERLKSTEKLLDFVIRRAAAGTGSIEEKVAAAARISGILARIDNSVERSHYLKFAASELGVEESALLDELNKKLVRTGVYRGPGAPGGIRKKASAGMDKIEEELMHLALRFPEVASEVRAELKPDDFTDPRLRGLAAKLMEVMGEGGEVSIPQLLDALKDEDEKKLALSLAVREPMENVTDYAKGAIRRLNDANRDRELRGLQDRIRQAEENKDFGLLNKLQKEFVEWQKRKNSRK